MIKLRNRCEQTLKRDKKRGKNNMNISTHAVMMIFIFTFIPLVLAEIARSRFRYTLEDFFLQSRDMGLGVAFFTITALFLSSFSILGATNAYSHQGPLFMTSFSWTILFGLMFYVFGRRIWFLSNQHGYITPSDFFDAMYRNKFLSNTITGIMIVYTVPYLVLQVFGGAYIIEVATDGRIPIAVGGLVCYLIIIIFLWSGGLRTVIMTDVFYGAIILISMIFMGFFFVRQVGSLEACFSGSEALYGTDFFKLGSLTDENSALAWFALFLIIPFGIYMSPPMWIRTYSVRNASTFRYLPLLLGATGIAYIGPIIAGNAAGALFPDLVSSDNLLISMVKATGVEMAGVLILCGVAAAALSTANSQVHAVSSMITMDIYKKHINRQATDRELINAAKWGILIICVVTYFMMFIKETDMAKLALMSFSGTANVFVPVWGALFWKKSNSKAAAAGLWAGILIVIVLHLFDLSLVTATIIGFTVNALIFGIGSKMLPEDSLAYETISKCMDEYNVYFHDTKI